MRLPRRVYLSIIAALVFGVLIGAWFFQNFERKPYETRRDAKPEALRNPFLAAAMLLKELGYRVQTVEDVAYLERLPARATLILTKERRFHLTPERAETLFAWVEMGGYLLADAGISETDPILQRLDIHSPPRASRRSPTEAEPANDDKQSAVENAKRELQQPESRIVSIPGYGKPLRMRARSARPFYVGQIPPAWVVENRNTGKGDGVELADFNYGSGHVTLINDLQRFANEKGIELEDHAEILAALLLTHQPQGEVYLMSRLTIPSLWEWLFKHHRIVIFTAALLLAFWLWQIVPRRGIARTQVAAERRSLVEHLLAIGRFLWRKKAPEVLIDAIRSGLHSKIVSRFFAYTIPTDEVCAELARRSGLTQNEVEYALNGNPKTADEFVRAVKTLQQLDLKLQLESKWQSS